MLVGEPGAEEEEDDEVEEEGDVSEAPMRPPKPPTDHRVDEPTPATMMAKRSALATTGQPSQAKLRFGLTSAPAPFQQLHPLRELIRVTRDWPSFQGLCNTMPSILEPNFQSLSVTQPRRPPCDVVAVVALGRGRGRGERS